MGKKSKGKKKKREDQVQTGRAARLKLSPEESLKRMREFPKRKEKFIALIREGTDGSVYP